MKTAMLHADLRNPHYLEWLGFLRRSESWGREEIEDFQLLELQRVVTHAYHRTSGYRELYHRAGITPDMVRTLDDFRKLPFVEKELIRDNLAGFSNPLRGSSYVTTGGSTGIPFGFYRDKAAFGKELASKAYQYYRVGWKEGDRQMVFRGLPIRSRNRMQFYPRFNELRCSSYHLVPEWMEAYRRKAFEYLPEWVRCYPSSGYIFARFLQETERPFPPIKGVLCASENLYDFQKELISKVFGARVFSHYGHYEMAVLAGYCEYNDTYHVLPQYGYAELLDSEGHPITRPGQVGEIVATSFIMRATPFIRYQTRDLAIFKGWGCEACGRPYQIWERIEGRLQEFIVTRTGRPISMTAINMHDDIFQSIKQFQFYQDTKGVVTFKYVPKGECDATIVKDMKARLMVKLGDDMELQMEEVVEIPPSPRGKHRFLIQKIDLEYGDE